MIPGQERSSATAVTRLGVIGVGRMGRHHARLCTQVDGADLVGVVDGNETRRAEMVAQYGCAAFDSVDGLLAAGVDACIVATPTVTHRVIVERLLAAGVHCLVEKPLAPDPGEARAIAEASHRGSAILQVGHVVRFDPVMVAIRAIDGLRPRFVEVDRVSPMTFRSVDVGVVLDMMIHDLDVLIMLMGSEPQEIYANAVSVLGEAEDVCNARLVFPPGDDGLSCTANVTASRLALKTERKIRIISEDTYVSADFGERRGTVVRKAVNAQQLAEIRERFRRGEDLSSLNYLELVKVEPLAVTAGEPLRLQLESFLGAVRGGGHPFVDAEAGFAAVRTAQRIVDAARRAGARMV
ncbi:MAG: Gfo/Idh/MocA family oxidoreductase [Phycisphaerales bacterium]|nr:Gfo/Idh/MocA family oxidoreductase [Phycisphaerales bacterium]